MHIVFLGNCQVDALRGIIDRFVAPYESLTTDFVDAYENIDASSYERLQHAEIVVAQVSGKPPRLDHAHIPPGIATHLVPVVSGAFLWPYQGVPHPLKPVVRYGNPPYTPEYNDRFLAERIMAGTPPYEAVAQYRALDVAGSAHVGRVYELTLEMQRQLDAKAGYGCATIIETYLAQEQLFQSAFHFGGRIARHIAGTLCDRMGFDRKYSLRINEHLTEAPFVPRFVPVHPSIAAHFGMRWVDQNTRYPFLWEGEFTFDEYVLRFMEARWSAALQEGLFDAQRGNAGARQKLEQGLKEAPNSARGHHELSRIVETDGDLALAMELQFRALQLDPTISVLLRYADLLLRAGDRDAAVAVLYRATRVDPVSLGAWTRLRNQLMRLRHDKAALAAAGKVVEFATDPGEAQAFLDRLSRAQAP